MATAIDGFFRFPSINATNGTLTDEFINGLVQGGSWQFGNGPHRLTYSLNINWDYDGFGNIVPGSGGAWTPALTDAVNRALTEWSNVANITFQNATSSRYFYQSSADLAFTLTGDELQTFYYAVGMGIFPDPSIAYDIGTDLAPANAEYFDPAGDIFFDNYFSGNLQLGAGGFGLDTLIHEIGHALGLKHPSDNGGNNRPTFEAMGIPHYDNGRYSVMSIQANADATDTQGNGASPMPLDILAIQYIYGANMSFHAGDDVYTAPSLTTDPYRTIWDAGGTDTIDASGIIAVSSGLTMDLRPGIGFVDNLNRADGFTAIAFNVTIENAIGSSGNDIITGNDAANRLDGHGGNDTLTGGLGNDTYGVDTTFDVIHEFAGEGSDTVQSSISWTLAPTLENLTLVGTAPNGIGNVFDNIILGSASDNPVLRGEGGADTIYGGSGNDWIDGETGNDPFAGVAGNDTLNGDEGDDTILAGAGDDVLYGGAGTDFLVGELGNDLVYGGSEWDAIDGRQGRDVLIGEGGNDIIFGDGYFYLFGFAGDSLFGGDGNDIIMGEAGENSVSGSSDTLYGEAGNDLLDGSGGDDVIYGGDGNDVIDGDHGNDYIVGGVGAETLLGSNAVAFGGPTEGSDLFVYESLSDGGDTIYGFDMRAGNNDGIDLRPLFNHLGYTGADPRGAGFLHLFQNAANTDLYIDGNGAAGGVNLDVPLLTLVDTTATSLTDSFFLFQ